MIRESTVDGLTSAIDRASAYLRGEQNEAGYWCGTVEMGVTTTLQDFLQRAFLGTLEADVRDGISNYVVAWQNDDGGFPKFNGGPSELSPSIEAYLTLRLAGHDPCAGHMAKASAAIRNLGGLEEAPGFPTRFWLAAFGLLSWDEVHPVPPELVLMPRWVPGNFLDFGAWVRQMLASFAIFTVKRPVCPQPFDLRELATGLSGHDDKGLKHRAERLVLAWNRRRDPLLLPFALRRAEKWLVEHQDEAGYWCGGFSYAPMSLCAAGRPLTDPVVARALAAIDKLAVWRGDQRFTQPLNSHIGDTSLAIPALIGAGINADDPSVVAAARWLLDNEVRGRVGDWVGKRPEAIAGAWPFEIGNQIYPDNDDTSWVVRALKMVTIPEQDRKAAAIERGLEWMRHMQSQNGGWGAFDADNTSRIASWLYDNAGPVTDPPTADVTSHVVQTMSEAGRGGSDAVQRGLDFLWSVQEPEGCWEGRWFINYIFGTSTVLLALAALDRLSDDRARRAVGWLKSVQNPDGGWGETFHTYRDRSRMAQGDSTPSQTSWAVSALSAAEPLSAEVAKGVRWLVDHQQENGSWHEPQFTAASLTPFYDIRYSLMAEVIFPLTALGDFRRSQLGSDDSAA